MQEQCRDSLKRIIKNCLDELKKLGFKSIAFPAIGTGALKYPNELAASTIIDTCLAFLQDEDPNNQFDIQIVIFEENGDVYEVNNQTKN